MAKTNKYTSINFNDIFEKKSNSKSSSSSSSPLTSSTPSSSSLHKPRGGMLVLTRPTPKPLPQLLQPQNPKPQSSDSSSASGLHRSRSEPDSSNPISLRPLGRTGSSSLSPPLIPYQEREREQTPPVSASLKPEPFVPPHLRPGFAGKVEKVGVNGQRVQIQNQNHQNQVVRSVEIGAPNGFAENGRPRTVGGYERMRRGGGEYDVGDGSRPSSSGHRPGSGSGYRPGSGGGNRPGSGGGNRPSSGSGNRPVSGGGWYGAAASYRAPTSRARSRRAAGPEFPA